MGAELATVQHDAFADGLALGVVILQRGVDIVVCPQGIGKCALIAGGFCDAEPHMRSRRGGCVADEGYAAKYQSRRGKVVDRCEEWSLNTAEHVEKRRRQFPFCFRAQV